MKVQLDENLSPALARALNAVCAVDDHEVIHVTDYAKGSKDELLFALAVQAGIEVHITQDHHFRRGVEKETISRVGLIVFVLASGWNDMEHYQKAAWLIEWWPKIIALAALTAPGGIYIVPACNARRGRIKQYQRK